MWENRRCWMCFNIIWKGEREKFINFNSIACEMFLQLIDLSLPLNITAWTFLICFQVEIIYKFFNFSFLDPFHCTLFYFLHWFNKTWVIIDAFISFPICERKQRIYCKIKFNISSIIDSSIHTQHSRVTFCIILFFVNKEI